MLMKTKRNVVSLYMSAEHNCYGSLERTLLTSLINTLSLVEIVYKIQDFQYFNFCLTFDN